MLLLPRSELLAGDIGSWIRAASGADCAVFDLATFVLTGAGISCTGELHRIHKAQPQTARIQGHKLCSLLS